MIKKWRGGGGKAYIHITTELRERVYIISYIYIMYITVRAQTFFFFFLVLYLVSYYIYYFAPLSAKDRQRRKNLLYTPPACVCVCVGKESLRILHTKGDLPPTPPPFCIVSLDRPANTRFFSLCALIFCLRAIAPLIYICAGKTRARRERERERLRK